MAKATCPACEGTCHVEGKQCALCAAKGVVSAALAKDWCDPPLVMIMEDGGFVGIVDRRGNVVVDNSGGQHHIVSGQTVDGIRFETGPWTGFGEKLLAEHTSAWKPLVGMAKPTGENQR